MADIYYVRQKEQRGLGDAIYCARKHIDGEPFAVLLGDTITRSKIPCIKQLMDVFYEHGSSTIAIEEIDEEKIERYGIIKGTKIADSLYRIEDLVEKPKIHEAPSNLGIIGRYILTPEIFDCIEETPPGVGGEIQLTDAMGFLEEIYGFVFEGKVHDIGNKVDWLKSSVELALENEKVGEELKEYLKEILKN